MKRMWIGALGLTLAVVAGGCGTEAVKTATVTDSGSTTDVAAAARPRQRARLMGLP